MKRIAAAAFLLILGLWGAAPARAATTPEQILKEVDQILRSQSHRMTVTLDVKTPRWQRNYKFNVWMKGVDYALARILEPAKVEGQGFLRLQSRLWNYLPSAERTILIPPSMMLDHFMGSDFTNDDFVKLTYLPRDYEGQIVGPDTLEGDAATHLRLIPRPDAPVTYSRLELWVRQKDSAPLRIEFYDENSGHLRTLHYLAYRNFGGHEAPSIWKMENIKDPGRETVVTVLDAAYNVSIDDAIFTRGQLERYP